MDKKEVEGIIERFADKTLSFGCRILYAKDRRFYKYQEIKNPKLERGGLIAPAIGTIIGKSELKRRIPYTKNRNHNFYWCVSDDNISPWRTPDDNPKKILGHPVYIGDVLEKMKELGILFCKNDEGEITENDDWLLEYWGNCGFTKSLQEIVEASGWEDLYDNCYHEERIKHRPNYLSGGNLKDPNAQALFDFLNTLNS